MPPVRATLRRLPSSRLVSRTTHQMFARATADGIGTGPAGSRRLRVVDRRSVLGAQGAARRVTPRPAPDRGRVHPAAGAPPLETSCTTRHARALLLAPGLTGDG